MARKPSKRSVRKSSKARKSKSSNKIKRSKPVKSKAKGSARKRPAAKKSASRSKVASRRPSASAKRAVPGKKKPAARVRAASKSKAPAKMKAPAKVPAKAVSAPKSATAPSARAAASAGRGASPGRSARSGGPDAQATLEFEIADPAIVEKVHVDPHMPVMPKRRSSKVGGPDWPGENLTVGMPAPEFSLPSTLGRKVSLNEFRGKRVILYFYPKDDTPGCTQEACAFRDNLSRIEAKDAVVLGISLDDELSHQRFAQKYNLTFPLLSDMDAAVSRQYGVYKEKNLYGRSFWGIERTTFAIDREGKVENVFRRVKVEGHADEVLATLAV